MKRYSINVHREPGTTNWVFDVVAGNGTVMARSTHAYAMQRDAVRAARSLVAADFDLDDIKVVKS